MNLLAGTHLRLARPVSSLERSVEMYRRGLGLEEIGHFEDHDGFDGVMIGVPGGGYHFEFTHSRHGVTPTPTPEDLIVFYLPETATWEAACAAMLAAGFVGVTPLNPYWAARGRTFEDFDRYRIVLQNEAWVAGR